MAPRRGQRPAKDRLAAAKHEADTTAGVIRVHNGLCSQCHRAGQDTARLCDTGWDLIKQLTRNRNRVRKIEDEISMLSLQGTLW